MLSLGKKKGEKISIMIPAHRVAVRRKKGHQHSQYCETQKSRVFFKFRMPSRLPGFEH